MFAFSDDYSFGVLQSELHWRWFVARCSMLKGDWRYTSETVFDSFPWPQEATKGQVKKVAAAAVALREARRRLMKEGDLSLRQLYRSLETPGEHELKNAHADLDVEVLTAYGMRKADDPLQFLLDLNQEVAGEPASKQVGPGLPLGAEDAVPKTSDCVKRAVDPSEAA